MKVIKIVIGIVLCLGVLAGCGDKDDVKASKDKTEQTSGNANGNEIKDSKDSNKDDQLDLHIGDTGTIKTEYQGTFEVTLESVSTKNKIGDMSPDYDMYAVVKVKIKNVGKEEISGQDVSNIVELLNNNKNAGSSADDGDVIPVENPISDISSIAPSGSVEGNLVYDTWKADQYQLMFGYASEGFMNKVVWTFTPDEAK